MDASIEKYRTQLETVAAALDGIADELSIRGDDAAQFLFAAARGRAIELSKSDAGIWVEFWDGNADSPNHESTFDSYESAVHDVSRWLTVNDDS